MNTHERTCRAPLEATSTAHASRQQQISVTLVTRTNGPCRGMTHDAVALGNHERPPAKVCGSRAMCGEAAAGIAGRHIMATATTAIEAARPAYHTIRDFIALISPTSPLARRSESWAQSERCHPQLQAMTSNPNGSGYRAFIVVARPSAAGSPQGVGAKVRMLAKSYSPY
jgi:hypothetical protein